jgi:hypothetical protein
MLQLLGDNIARAMESVRNWIALFVVLVFVKWMKFTSKAQGDAKQPPSLSHILPFVGHAFKLAGNKRKFFIDSL